MGVAVAAMNVHNPATSTRIPPGARTINHHHLNLRCAIVQLLYDIKFFVSSQPAGLLEVGLHHPLHVREERLSGAADTCRLLYISDIHLRHGRSDLLLDQILEAAIRSRPQAVLLGGDLIDRRSELDKLSTLIRRLHTIAPVLAVAGNHDYRVGLACVREAVVRSGGHWIHDRAALVTYKGRVVAVSGPDCPPSVDGHVRVLCAHNPRIWRTHRHAGYDLVLAGHLHGCQMVGWQHHDRLFPGAIFYPYCFLSHRSGPTRLVVSRGVSDLVPIRWRCPREVVLCHV
jgi:predicted MPP superfamily phosphohydrolase